MLSVYCPTKYMDSTFFMVTYVMQHIIKHYMQQQFNK